jgi:hypothetical protein
MAKTGQRFWDFSNTLYASLHASNLERFPGLFMICLLLIMLFHRLVHREYAELVASRADYIASRRMIRSRKAYIGLAPNPTKAGDYIALVKGGRVPLVLRPKGNDWELIGDAYVHGIIYGEVFKE